MAKELFPESPQNVSTNLEREVGRLQWRAMEGVCSCANGGVEGGGDKKKTCSEKMQSPAHPSLNSKGSLKALLEAGETASSRRTRTGGRGRSQGLGDPSFHSHNLSHVTRVTQSRPGGYRALLPAPPPGDAA